jgi:hypothetical protein
LDEFLAHPLFAHLATTSDEGPRESPVWFLWEESAIWILGNRRTDTFPARIKREARCAVGIVDSEVSTGRVHHAGIRGRAVVVPFDRNRAIRLLARYLGGDLSRWDARFRESLDDPENVLVRVEPETVVVRDVSYVVGAKPATLT